MLHTVRTVMSRPAGACLQGGSTTFLKGLQFLQDGLPSLATWSWGSQGVFLDTDGTLLSPDTLAAPDWPASWTLGPGATLHSGVETKLLDEPECVYINGGNAAYCRPELTFRRVMLHGHAPPSLVFR